MKLKSKTFLPILSASIIPLISGCGSSEHHATEEHPVFKGTVVRVEYHTTEGFTLLTDSEGKETKLEGYPGVPCTEVEIHKHGREYEIFRAPKQG